MKKKESKVLALILMLAMVLSVSMLMTSCGEPSTLEEYLAENEELQEQLNSLAESQEDMTVEIKENQILYTYTMPQQIEEDILEDVKAKFEETMESLGSTFEGIASTCEEETKIKGITVKVTYLNNDGSEIYSQEYEAKSE